MSQNTLRFILILGHSVGSVQARFVVVFREKRWMHFFVFVCVCVQTKEEGDQGGCSALLFYSPTPYLGCHRLDVCTIYLNTVVITLWSGFSVGGGGGTCEEGRRRGGYS